jgi:hypothetical protein
MSLIQGWSLTWEICDHDIAFRINKIVSHYVIINANDSMFKSYLGNLWSWLDKCHWFNNEFLLGKSVIMTAHLSASSLDSSACLSLWQCSEVYIPFPSHHSSRHQKLKKNYFENIILWILSKDLSYYFY